MSLMKNHQANENGTAEKSETKTATITGSRDLKGLGLATEIQRNLSLIMQDLPLLKAIKSHPQRNQEKAEIMKKYDSFIEAYLAQDKRIKNPVLVWLMIWAFDSKQISKAMVYAKLCIAAGDEMPKDNEYFNFKSTVTEFVFDNLFDFLEEEHNANRTCEPYLSDALLMLETLDTFDQVKAKFLKLQGMCLDDSDNLPTLERALDSYNRAMALYSKVGCKTRRDDLVKKIKKLMELEESQKKAQKENGADSGDETNSEESETESGADSDDNGAGAS